MIYYIITDTATKYTHPDFVVVPSVCNINYQYSETEFNDANSTPTTAITRTGKEFTIEYSADLSPVSPTP